MSKPINRIVVEFTNEDQPRGVFELYVIVFHIKNARLTEASLATT
jgi:hypothetical protein